MDRTKLRVIDGESARGSIPLTASALAQGDESAAWHEVDFSMQHQTEIEWCWAADAVSIDLFFDKTSRLTQCAVANTVLGRTDCCTNPDSPDCDQPQSMTHVLTTVGRLRLHLKTPLSFDDLKQEIDSGKPVGAHISWETEGGHIPIIVGYREGSQTLAIADPLYGQSEVDYDTFKTSYRQIGRWDESYLLQ